MDAEGEDSASAIDGTDETGSTDCGDLERKCAQHVASGVKQSGMQEDLLEAKGFIACS